MSEVDQTQAEYLRALRAKVGLSVRKMSALAMLVNETGWGKAEISGKMDPARLKLVEARVALLTEGPMAAARVLRDE